MNEAIQILEDIWAMGGHYHHVKCNRTFHPQLTCNCGAEDLLARIAIILEKPDARNSGS